MRTLSIFVISLFLLAASACRKKDPKPDLRNACFTGEVLREEKNMTVTIMMVTGDICQVGPDIPTGYWYYACNVPEALREKGRKIKITGVVLTRAGEENVYNFVVTHAEPL